MKFTYTTQERAPQYGSGVDWSASGTVLIRTKERWLVWRKSGSCWAGIGMDRSYVPTRLHVVLASDARVGSYDDLSITGADLMSGGRLSRKRLATVMPQIRKLMRLPTLKLDQIDLKRTLVAA